MLTSPPQPTRSFHKSQARFAERLQISDNHLNSIQNRKTTHPIVSAPPAAAINHNNGDGWSVVFSSEFSMNNAGANISTYASEAYSNKFAG